MEDNELKLHRQLAHLAGAASIVLQLRQLLNKKGNEIDDHILEKQEELRELTKVKYEES